MGTKRPSEMICASGSSRRAPASTQVSFVHPFPAGSCAHYRASLTIPGARGKRAAVPRGRRIVLASAYKRGKSRSENQYVYVPAVRTFLAGTLVELAADEQQHLRARRVRAPAAVRLFNGRGESAMATLCEGGGTAQVAVEDGDGSASSAARVPLAVCFCVPRKASRADWAVEKLTELGVSSIMCFQSARSVDGLSEAKVSRFERICVAAAKQSLQLLIPEVHALSGGLRDVCTLSDRYDMCFLLSPEGKPILRVLSETLTTPSASILIVAGPEGGFSDAEEAELVASGFVQVELGSGRLRVETAVLAATAAVVFAVDAVGYEGATA